MPNAELLQLTESGLYCAAGDFYIDPWRRVPRAVVTHAHSDHARPGMGHTLVAKRSERLIRQRLGDSTRIETAEYGEVLTIGGARLSLHPAGHILGSAQVRIEVNGEVAVVTGDYKTAPDPTCEAYEPIRCHLMVTESTFGLPLYRWPSPESVAAEMARWWAENQAAGRCSLLMGYALGKAQRALSLLNPEQGPIFLHGAVEALTRHYRTEGVSLPPTVPVSQAPKDTDWSRAVVIAPPSAQGTPWTRRFGETSSAFCSGWMALRGARRRRALDRGFVLSDHVDWPSLIEAVDSSGAEEVWVTHGYASVVARYLQENGRRARVLETLFEGELDSAEEDETLGAEGAPPEAAAEEMEA